MRQDLIWGAGPSAIENITKGEFNTDPDTINTEHGKTTTTIQRLLHIEAKCVPQSRRFLLGNIGRK